PPTSPYSLSLHDALPISFVLSSSQSTICPVALLPNGKTLGRVANPTSEAKVSTIRSSPTTFKDSYNPFAMKYIHSKETLEIPEGDRKSTRLNSSHLGISY